MVLGMHTGFEGLEGQGTLGTEEEKLIRVESKRYSTYL